jgi:GNAT superfamily N-acetyltransferase
VKYTIELLDRSHNRRYFDCGEESLNDFLKKFARQNSEKGLGRTFVAVPANSKVIYGYYTIASGTVRFDTIPEKLPRYPIPVILLGRLAVDEKAKGQGLGEYLLMDALKQVVTLAEILGIYAVEVYALNDRAREFYKKYGFIELLDDPLHLFLPMKTIKALNLK